MVRCGWRWGPTLWIYTLIGLTALVATIADAQSEGQRVRFVRRGGNVIRTRLSSGIPVRRFSPRIYDPVYEATETKQGYAYPDPNSNHDDTENEPAASDGYQYRPTTVGYKYSRTRTAVETTTENIEHFETEAPEPVSPQKIYTANKINSPLALETDENIDADFLAPVDGVKPVEPEKVALLNNEDGEHSHNHGDDVWPDGYKGVIPGVEGVDYPILSKIPETSFSCSSQQYSGYYADEEARCQVFHVCLRRLRRRSIEKWSFLCPNGTIFSQEDFVCVWWNNAPACDTATLTRLYQLNEKLGWDNHGESATKSIKTIMDNMVQSQKQTLPAPLTSVNTIEQSRSFIQNPLISTGSSQQQKPNRIQVKLTTSLGTGSNKRMKISTTVPITRITPDEIITSPSPQTETQFEKETVTENEPNFNDYDIDSQAITNTRTTSQKEERSKSKTGSALLKSESEAYEEFGGPDGLENPEPFIVNKPSVQDMSQRGEEDQSLEIKGNEVESVTDAEVPTIVMMPIQQQYPDGSSSVLDMPVVMMMKPQTQKQAPIGFPPAAVVNPNGITIPNTPQTPPRGYLPPRQEVIVSLPPTTTTSAPVTTTSAPTPQVEEESQTIFDYNDPDKEPPGTKPVIEYEINNSAVQPITVTTESTPPKAELANTYLPPRGEASTTTSRPEPTYSVPVQTPEIETTQPEPEPSTTTTAAAENESEVQIDSEKQNVEASVDPSAAYLPPKTKMSSLQTTATPDQSSLVTMDGNVVNSILESSGIEDPIEDGQKIETFSASPQTIEQEDEEIIHYPTPMTSHVNQDNTQDVGTATQFYNGNVRTLYSTKMIPTGNNDNEQEQLTTSLPIFDKEKNNELLRQIQHGRYDESKGNKLADGLERITPGYIDLPLRPNPTQSSPSEIPGTESVQAFLTSQKNVDPKQTLEIQEYNKYALYVPQGSKNVGNSDNTISRIQDGTPAPTGLVQGPPSTQSPGKNIESLFGPLARDVIPQIQLPLVSSSSKPKLEVGYNYNQPESGSQPQKPKGLYGLPTSSVELTSNQESADQQQQQQKTNEIIDKNQSQINQWTPYNNNKSEQSKQQQRGAQEPVQSAIHQNQNSHQNQAVQLPSQQQYSVVQQPSGGYRPIQSAQNLYVLQRPQIQQFQPSPTQQYQPLPPPPTSPQNTVTFQQPQIQLPVVVESHTTHTVPVVTPPPQLFIQQLQQQQQQQQQQTQFVPVQLQQSPHIPTQLRPSGLYSPPSVSSHVGFIQPQSSVLTNSIQLPQVPLRLQLPVNPFGPSKITEQPEVIPAIPVHSQTIIERRPIQAQHLQPIHNNNLNALPAFVPQQYNLQSLVSPANGYAQQQNKQQQQLQNNNNQGGYRQNAIPNQQYHHQQRNQKQHNFEIQQARTQQINFPIPQQQASASQHHLKQGQGYQYPKQQQQQSHQQQQQIQQHNSINHAQVQHQQQQRQQQQQQIYPQRTHYNRNSIQPQASVTGYQNNAPVIQGQKLNMFNSHEGTRNIQYQNQQHQQIQQNQQHQQIQQNQQQHQIQQNQQHQQNHQQAHQQNHQQAHQQNIQNFINHQQQQIQNGYTSQANNNNQNNNPHRVNSNIAQPSHRTPAVQPLLQPHSAPSNSHHTQLPSPNRNPTGGYGTGTGSQLEMANEQVAYSNYEVFYPGKDKSLGVKLTYDFTD